jgi:hypothetical protein
VISQLEELQFDRAFAADHEVNRGLWRCHFATAAAAAAGGGGGGGMCSRGL